VDNLFVPLCAGNLQGIPLEVIATVEMNIGHSVGQYLYDLFIAMHACCLDGPLARASPWGVVDGVRVKSKDFANFFQLTFSRRKL
jgi:hypothetical protein